MDSIVIILVLLAMISVLVVAHEWGHFIVARIFKIRVDDFSIGFGPRILRIGKLGDTEYNIRAFPLGGFVKIAGMDPDEEPLIRARDAITGSKGSIDLEATRTVAPSDDVDPEIDSHDQFYSKPIWQRALVILAGPVMSFIFGVMVFCVIGFTVGIPDGPPTARIAQVLPGGQAYLIGLRSGDEIKQVNDQQIQSGTQLISLIRMNYGDKLRLIVSREGKTLTFDCKPAQFVDPETGNPVYAQKVLDPKSLASQGVMPGDIIHRVDETELSTAQSFPDTLKSLSGKTVPFKIWRDGQDITANVKLAPALISNAPTVQNYPVGMLNFQPMFEIQHLSVADSIKSGLAMTGNILATMGSMFQHHQIKQLKESTGGIVMMYSVTGLAVKNGMSTVFLIAGELSISLAIFNLLPIPVLDGGHLLTFFIEWVRRGKRFTDQQQQVFLITGVLVIGTLFALIFTNDIHRLISHQVPQ